MASIKIAWSRKQAETLHLQSAPNQTENTGILIVYYSS